MKNLNDMNVSELKIALADFFDEASIEEIFRLYTHEEITQILHQEREEISAMDSATSKPVSSRKHRGKTTQTVEYKKQKAKKWIEKRRTNVKTEETTNRAYLNKASKGYTKLHPHVKPKTKKSNKNS